MDPQQNPGYFFLLGSFEVMAQDPPPQFLGWQVTPVPAATYPWKYPQYNWGSIPFVDPRSGPAGCQSSAEVPRFPNVACIPHPMMSPQKLRLYPS
jgi:hypothetical protein